VEHGEHNDAGQHCQEGADPNVAPGLSVKALPAQLQRGSEVSSDHRAHAVVLATPMLARFPLKSGSSARSDPARLKMTFLTRSDPSRNIDRFYVVAVMPTLFGEFALLRENGRRGSPGTLRLTSYERRDDAEAAERRTIKRRLQHGYTVHAYPCAAAVLPSGAGVPRFARNTAIGRARTFSCSAGSWCAWLRNRTALRRLEARRRAGS
jgi:predicted DNA-binding WGR domain protein